MRARPPEFLHSITIRKLRMQLRDVCQQCLRASRLKGALRGTRDITYDYSTKEYAELARKRDQIISEIKTIWNSEAL